jgi:hypothetical protein
VEVRSNTSIVTPRVVEGDEKGSLKSERIKYDHESQRDSEPRKTTLARPSAYAKDRPVLSSERAPCKNKTITVKE